jgi:uncharacterized protein (TIGR02118 family)
MAHVLVMFNLKEGVSAEEYEIWARDVDAPTVRGLPSVDSFTVLRAARMLMGDGTPPYAYTETIEVNDLDTFGTDVQTQEMQAVSAQFQQFADDPVFVLLERFV